MFRKIAETKGRKKDRMFRKMGRAVWRRREREQTEGGRGIHAGLRRLWDPESCFPPGYEYWKWERDGAVFLLAIGAVLSLRFFGRLYQMVKGMYLYVGKERVLREDAREMLIPFRGLMQGHWGLCVPFLLFLTIMVIWHYFYYFHRTKSIYLMRRLPARGALAASCLRGPLLGMAIGAAVFGLLQLLYYGIYLLALPQGCIP